MALSGRRTGSKAIMARVCPGGRRTGSTVATAIMANICPGDRRIISTHAANPATWAGHA